MKQFPLLLSVSLVLAFSGAFAGSASADSVDDEGAKIEYQIKASTWGRNGLMQGDGYEARDGVAYDFAMTEPSRGFEDYCWELLSPQSPNNQGKTDEELAALERRMMGAGVVCDDRFRLFYAMHVMFGPHRQTMRSVDPVPEIAGVHPFSTRESAKLQAVYSRMGEANSPDLHHSIYDNGLERQIFFQSELSARHAGGLGNARMVLLDRDFVLPENDLVTGPIQVTFKPDLSKELTLTLAPNNRVVRGHMTPTSLDHARATILIQDDDYSEMTAKLTRRANNPTLRLEAGAAVVGGYSVHAHLLGDAWRACVPTDEAASGRHWEVQCAGGGFLLSTKFNEGSDLTPHVMRRIGIKDYLRGFSDGACVNRGGDQLASGAGVHVTSDHGHVIAPGAQKESGSAMNQLLSVDVCST